MVNNSYLCRMKNRIEHSGRVESIDGEWVMVRIVQSSACSSCEARKLCQSAESKEKIVKCRSYGVEYHVGDEVMVYGAMSMGRDAVIIAFVVPLVLIIVWLFCAVGLFHINELIAIGVMAVLLGIYYLTIHLMNRVLSKKFELWIKKNV